MEQQHRKDIAMENVVVLKEQVLKEKEKKKAIELAEKILWPFSAVWLWNQFELSVDASRLFNAQILQKYTSI